MTFPLGRHLIADLSGVDEMWLTDTGRLENLLHEAARLAGATPLFGKFHQFGEGNGVTGVLLLQESHISIHTWPEYRFAAVDAFMCGACRPELAIACIRDALRPEQFRLTEEARSPALMPPIRRMA
jgi:S-adenosylmethionine decarboxylase